FTPDFAVAGQVANQNGDPEGGWAVFLDYNDNHIQDSTEPGTQTNAGGFYSFTRVFSKPGIDPVPVGKPFQVVLPALSNSVLDPGFETRQAPFTSSFNPLYWYSPSGSPWTFTSTQIPGNGAGLVANGSGFNNPAAPEGTQAAFLQRKGSFTQTVSLNAGTYRLSFM